MPLFVLHGTRSEQAQGAGGRGRLPTPRNDAAPVGRELASVWEASQSGGLLPKPPCLPSQAAGRPLPVSPFSAVQMLSRRGP